MYNDLQCKCVWVKVKDSGVAVVWVVEVVKMEEADGDTLYILAM